MRELARAPLDDRDDGLEADRLTYRFSATVLGLSLLLTIYVGQYMEIVELNTRISQHRQRTEAAERKIRRLEIRRAALSRLQRLEFAAEERLGLVLPSQSNVRYLPVTGDYGQPNQE